MLINGVRSASRTDCDQRTSAPTKLMVVQRPAPSGGRTPSLDKDEGGEDRARPAGKADRKRKRYINESIDDSDEDSDEDIDRKNPPEGAIELSSDSEDEAKPSADRNESISKNNAEDPSGKNDDIWGYLRPSLCSHSEDAAPLRVPPLELPGAFGRIELLGPLLGLPCAACDALGGKCGTCRALWCLARYTPRKNLLRFDLVDDGDDERRGDAGRARRGLLCTVTAGDRLVRVSSRGKEGVPAGGAARGIFVLSDGDSVVLWGYRSGAETQREPDMVPLVRFSLEERPQRDLNGGVDV